MTIIAPHNVQSRPVTPADYDRVAKDAAMMIDIIHSLIEKRVWAGAYALAHAQVTQDDPLCFFVFDPDNKAVQDDWGRSPIVVNPLFTPEGTLKKAKEQCITFPRTVPAPTLRYEKGIITCDVGGSEKYARTVKGVLAQVFQHELDHFSGKYVYQVVS